MHFVGDRLKRIQCRICKGFTDFKEDWTCSEDCRGIAKKRDEQSARILKELEGRREEQKRSSLALKAEWRRKRADKRNTKKKTQLERLTKKNFLKFNKDRARIISKLQTPALRPGVILRKVGEQAKQIRALKQGKHPDGFYETREWQELRYRVLRHWGRKCMLCSATGCELHVDHIKPRSKYPELSLVFDNLQILCRPCNMGKSNKDDTDWRPRI